MDQDNKTLALILAAGEGSRMKSKRPKVLHELLGRSLLSWVCDAALKASCSDLCVVIGKGAEQVSTHLDEYYKNAATQMSYFEKFKRITAFSEHLPFKQETGALSFWDYDSKYIAENWKLTTVVQEERKGTGHAVMVAAKEIQASKARSILVLSGDSPLLTSSTLRELIAVQQAQHAACAILSFETDEPFGYGRIVRNAVGEVCAIVEQKDCTQAQTLICECNSGVYCFDKERLLEALDSLTTDNAQGEYYLTDVIAYCAKNNYRICTQVAQDSCEAHGVNSRIQLSKATKIMQERINAYHLSQGVSMLDPSQVWIEPQVTLEQDSYLLPQTHLRGLTYVGEDCVIGPQTTLEDSYVSYGCTIRESCVEKAYLEPEVHCGPRAYLRAKTYMEQGSKAGSCVEIKNSRIGKGSKVPHLSYIGDASVGGGVNIGAGTITCNYDGVHKHKTQIGEGAFIGSATMLVAPVSIGAYALTGAGSTITQNVSEGALALERNEQREILGYRHTPKSSELLQ